LLKGDEEAPLPSVTACCRGWGGER